MQKESTSPKKRAAKGARRVPILTLPVGPNPPILEPPAEGIQSSDLARRAKLASESIEQDRGRALL